MPIVLPINDVSKRSIAIAGGKGASLGELTEAGMLVPPGYVILCQVFEDFLNEHLLRQDINDTLSHTNPRQTKSIEKASEIIQSLIMQHSISKKAEEEILSYFEKLNAKYVAVRSSATSEDSSHAAWAGQLDTYLNTTRETLLENIRRCWASLYSPRAIAYRFQKKLELTKISVAVVVQAMIESEVSGVAFSVHPVTQNYDHFIIEAGLGLGESIVSGQITPDSYVLEKKSLKIIEKTISTQEKGIYRSAKGGNEWESIPKSKGEKQKLTDKQLQELGKLVLQIEAHYAFPVDIEWAFAKGKFYITQSRPITTLR